MNIWVPRTKIIESELFLPGARVSGRFRITGRLDDGRERVLQDWTPNLITNGGLERWGAAAPIANCSVGSGTTPPTANDTALQTFQRQQTTASVPSIGAQTSEPWYGTYARSFVFDPPGVNIAIGEIGIGWGSNGTALWSRTLTKDAGGDPLVLNWLAQETLTITYQARRYPWVTDVPHTTVISGTTYTGILRPARIADAAYGFFNSAQQTAVISSPNTYPYVYSGDLGAITAVPLGSSYIITNAVNNAYVASSLEATGIITVPPTTGNFSPGIKSLLVPSTAQTWQVSFTPAIPKTTVQTLTFNVTSGKWGRKP